LTCGRDGVERTSRGVVRRQVGPIETMVLTVMRAEMMHI